MPRLIIPVLAMSALITVTDALLSDSKAAPDAARATAESLEPTDTFASQSGLNGTRRRS